MMKHRIVWFVQLFEAKPWQVSIVFDLSMWEQVSWNGNQNKVSFNTNN